MDVFKLKDFKGNWFIGAFRPTILFTNQFEIALVKHTKGQKWDFHTHKIATEYNLVVKGRIKMHKKVMRKGDIFVLYPDEVADPEFLTDCEILVIKIPSVKGDKYVIQS